MDAETFRSQLDELTKKLASRDPTPAHSWIGEKKLLDEIHQRAIWLLDNHAGIETIVESKIIATRTRLHVLDRVAAAAALLDVAGRSKDARALLERCADACPDVGDQRLYRAAAGDLATFDKLARAQWLWQNRYYDDARRLAATISERENPLAEAARRLCKAPTPIDKAPMLLSFYGFGLQLYGEGDPEPDGSHVKVRFLTALFVPLFPLDAYRLTENAGGYRIHGKVPLGSFMRLWRKTAPVLIALAIAWVSISSFLSSPERQLRLAVEEIVELESVDPEAALLHYEELAMQYNGIEDDVSLLPVAKGWVRAATADIAEPITPATVDQLTMVVDRYAAMPSRFQGEALAVPLVDRLLDLADQLPSDTSEGADARLDLLLEASRFAPPSRRARVDEATSRTRLILATQLAVDWPLEALRQYAKLLGHDPEAPAAITALLAELPDSPTLFAEIVPELEQWAPYVDEATKARARELGQRGVALDSDPERIAMLQANDETQLRAALAWDSTDQIATMALAYMLRVRGQYDEAVAQLEALGKPGVMIHEAQYLLAELEFDRGNDERAAILLEQMLRNRLPAFEDARRGFESEFHRLRENLVTRAERGQIPPQYETALTGNDEAAAQAAFGQWLDAEIEGSPAIARLRAEYQRHADIVPVAILLGTVQLQRARAVTGEQREQLLDSAQSTFLSIGGEARGMPEYHLALGQVYFRLGKNIQAKAEFQYLVENPDPHVQLLAASGYRDLGLVEEARKVAETVYEANVGTTDVATRAAYFVSMLVYTLEERRKWLERANSQDDYVRVALLDVTADELRRAGKFAAADKKYAEIYELQIAKAEQDNASFNNAALTLINRHYCTGDLEYVERAVELLQRAIAQEPDDAILMFNYASLLDFQVQLGILAQFVPTEGLRVSEDEVSRVLGELTHSQKRDEVLAAIQNDVQRTRAMDVWTRCETLSPQKVEVYFGQLDWFSLTEQAAELGKLFARIGAVENLDISVHEQFYREVLDGTSDERALLELSGSLEARAVAREQSKRANPATRAVLRQLDGMEYFLRANLERGEPALADARAAVEAFEAAQALWPEGLSTEELADALLLLAVFEIEANDPDATAAWHEHWRRDRLEFSLARLYDERAPLIELMKGHAAFQRSLELRRAAPDHNLDPLDVVVAKIAGDEELRLRALVVTNEPVRRIRLDIYERLMPYDKSFVNMRKWVDAERR